MIMLVFVLFLGQKLLILFYFNHRHFLFILVKDNNIIFEY